jgi:adhesin/invasin
MTLEGELMSASGRPHVIQFIWGVVPPGQYAASGPEFSFVATTRDVEWQQVLCTKNPPVSYGPDPTTSTIDADPTQMVAGESSVVTVQLRDESGNPLAFGGDSVVLYSSESLSPVSDNGDGTYTATFSSILASTHIISGSVNGDWITNEGSVAVLPGPAEPGASVVMAEFETVEVGSTSTIFVGLYDQYGNQLISGGDQVSCFISAGSGSLSSMVDNGDGIYSATLFSADAGQTVVGCLVNGVVVSDTATVEFVAPP